MLSFYAPAGQAAPGRSRTLKQRVPSAQVRLPMAGAEWPAVGDYVRIIGRLGLPKGSDAGSVSDAHLTGTHSRYAPPVRHCTYGRTLRHVLQVAGTPAATAQGGAGNSQDSSGAPRHATPTQGTADIWTRALYPPTQQTRSYTHTQRPRLSTLTQFGLACACAGGPTPRPHSSKQQPFITAHKVRMCTHTRRPTQYARECA